MSHVSKLLLRPVIAVVLSLGLALTAVGGTMAQVERDTTTADVTIAVTPPSSSGGSGGSGGTGGDSASTSVAVNVIPASHSTDGTFTPTVRLSLILPAVQRACRP